MKYLPLMRARTVSALLVLLLGAVQIALLTSCNETKQVQAAKIGLGNERKSESKVKAAALTSTKTVRFFTLGASQSTIFGGSKTPVSGNARIKVDLTTSVNNTGAAISKSKTDFNDEQTLDLTADAGGELKVYLKVGDKPGVYSIKGTAVDNNGEPLKDKRGKIITTTAVFLGGLVIESGNKQDGYVGNKLHYPIVIKVEKAPGEPAEGIQLIANPLSVPKKTKVSVHNKVTDSEGRFKIEVKTGVNQGKGKIGLRLGESPLGNAARDYQVELGFFAIDRTKLFITLLGGLAIFIFGMKLMSEGLSLTAGDKMKNLLNTLTKNRFAAAGAGVVTTGLIQSSSACTVMVIGFVNAGLMQLEQAIGVIMGANIGTTVTAQMISFKLTHLALPAITVGMIMLLLAKSSRVKFSAQILIGFGFLFFGMSLLGSPFKELKDSDLIKNLFMGISCDPSTDASTAVLCYNFLKAVFVGTLITVIVQSSSASIGLLLALAGFGLIDPFTGFAILLGTNIGTTITAILASIGTSINAKRAACAHCLFNVLGTVIMVALFFVPWPGMDAPVFMQLITYMTAGDNLAGENITRYLANCHTVFNIACTALFIWFVPVFAKLCRMIIPGDESAALERKSCLEPHLVATPSIAIQQTWAELGYMLELARKVHGDSFRAIIKTPKGNFDTFNEDIRQEEAELDRLQHAITEYIAEVSMRQLNEEQSEALPHLVHSVNDAERLGDHSIAFLKMARRIKKHGLQFSDQARQELDTLFATSEELYDQCSNIIGEIAKGEESHNPEMIRKHLDDAYVTMKKLKAQEKDFYKAHLIRQEEGSCEVGTGIVFLEAIRMLLRSGGHLINIIEAASPLQDAK